MANAYQIFIMLMNINLRLEMHIRESIGYHIDILAKYKSNIVVLDSEQLCWRKKIVLQG